MVGRIAHHGALRNSQILLILDSGGCDAALGCPVLRAGVLVDAVVRAYVVSVAAMSPLSRKLMTPEAPSYPLPVALIPSSADTPLWFTAAMPTIMTPS